MSTPLGIGVLGLGGIACTHHLPALRRIPGVSVVALSDPDPRARERAARFAPGAGRHDSAESLLARPDVDAVLIAAPTHLHAELAGVAAAAGKHIYIEKPLATSGADASRIIDAASRSGVRVAVGFNRRRHPLYAQARRVLAAERIGRVRSVHSAFSEPVAPGEMPGWKRSRSTGGGVLLDLGSHHFDLIRWFLDSEVEPLAARTGSERSEQDSAWVDFATSGGTEGHMLLSFLGAHADQIEFFGDRGVLRVDRHRGTLGLRVRRSNGYGIRPAWLRPSGELAAWNLRRLVGRGAEPSYERTLLAFVESLTQAAVEGAPSLEDGVKSLEAVLEAERLAGTSERTEGH
jgi:myo-inositol 2-dehydrogenase/D-chiro-inositol 1-dehydrogenase